MKLLAWIISFVSACGFFALAVEPEGLVWTTCAGDETCDIVPESPEWTNFAGNEHVSFLQLRMSNIKTQMATLSNSTNVTTSSVVNCVNSNQPDPNNLQAGQCRVCNAFVTDDELDPVALVCRQEFAERDRNSDGVIDIQEVRQNLYDEGVGVSASSNGTVAGSNTSGNASSNSSSNMYGPYGDASTLMAVAGDMDQDGKVTCVEYASMYYRTHNTTYSTAPSDETLNPLIPAIFRQEAIFINSQAWVPMTTTEPYEYIATR